MPEKVLGKKLGLGTKETIAHLLTVNERRPDKLRRQFKLGGSGHLTDLEIQMALNKEFGKKSYFSRVSNFRSRFNSGAFIPALGKPKRKSQKYGDDGKAMEAFARYHDEDGKAIGQSSVYSKQNLNTQDSRGGKKSKKAKVKSKTKAPAPKGKKSKVKFRFKVKH